MTTGWRTARTTHASRELIVAPSAPVIGGGIALAIAAFVVMILGPTPASAARPPGTAALPYAFVVSDDGNQMFATGAGVDVTLSAGSIAISDAHGTVARLAFVNSRTVVPRPAEASAGSFNVLRGNDPALWTTRDLHHGAVYEDLWDGIDMRVRSAGSSLKYEFVVRPGANPHDISLQYLDGATVRLDADGNLVATTAAGALVDAAPTAFQTRREARRDVAVAFDTSGSSTYGFAVGPYDTSADLVIDPNIEFSTFVGGSQSEFITDLAVDAAGNTVVVGRTQSAADFPVGGGHDSTFNGGTYDVFVAKVSATGDRLLYATFLGGSPTPLRGGGAEDREFAEGVTLDSAGNAYVVGYTSALDFPTTAGAFQTVNAAPPLDQRNGAVDAFVTKLTPQGTLSYSTYLGATGEELAFGVAVNSAGAATIVGSTSSTGFATTAGAAQSTIADGVDGFVTRLSPDGSSLQYSTYLGGAGGIDRVRDVALDGSGRAVVIGETQSDTFPTTAGAFDTTHSGGAVGTRFDVFATGFTNTGSLRFSTFVGAPGNDIANGLALGANGAVNIVGQTQSSTFPTTANAFDRSSLSGGFYARLDAEGSSLLYGTLGGGANLIDVAVGGGGVWIAGGAQSAPVTADAVQSVNAGNFDVWVANLDAADQLQFASFIGGTNAENAAAVAVASDGDVLLGGTTFSPTFPTTAGAFDRTFSGDPIAFWGDGFVVRLGEGGAPPSPPTTEFVTQTFSGEIRRNATVIQSVTAEASGPMTIDLNWERSRSRVTLTVLDGSGAVVHSDSTTARPKNAVIDVVPGTYQISLRNTTSRDTDYDLSVTYPVVGTTTTPVLSGVTVEPSIITGTGQATARVVLSAPAPAGGATVAMTSSAAALDVPATITVPSGQTVATGVVSSSGVTTTTSATVTAAYGGAQATASVSLRPVSLPSLTSVPLSPSTVEGGVSSTGTLLLDGPAPAGGLTVNLSSDSAAATVPAQVLIGEGQTSAAFTVTTSTVTSQTIARVTASRVEGEFPNVVSFALTITTAAPTPLDLESVQVTPTTIDGGTSTNGAVVLTDPAPLGGVAVQLSSSSPTVSVPSSVTVPSGNRAVSFIVAASTVTADETVVVTATLGATTRTVSVVVTGAVQPPPPPTTGSETATFSGELRRNSTVTHSVTATTSGQLSLDLNWARSRSQLTVTVRDQSGAVVYSDTSNSRPKQATFEVGPGGYDVVVTNTTRRDTDYDLSVTYPVTLG